MANDRRCQHCGSDKLIPSATVRLAGTLGPRALEVVVESGTPQNSRASNLQAQVCGDCGQVELYVDEPQALWRAHQQRHHS